MREVRVGIRGFEVDWKGGGLNLEGEERRRVENTLEVFLELTQEGGLHCAALHEMRAETESRGNNSNASQPWEEISYPPPAQALRPLNPNSLQRSTLYSCPSHLIQHPTPHSHAQHLRLPQTLTPQPPPSSQKIKHPRARVQCKSTNMSIHNSAAAIQSRLKPLLPSHQIQCTPATAQIASTGH